MQCWCYCLGLGGDSLVLKPLIGESDGAAEDCGDYGSRGVGNGSRRSADDSCADAFKDAEPIDGRDLVPLDDDLQGGMSFIYVNKEKKIVFKFPNNPQTRRPNNQLMKFKENSLKKELLILQRLKQETNKPHYFVDFLGVVTWERCLGLKLKKYSGDAHTFFSHKNIKLDDVILMLSHVIIALCYFHDALNHAHLDIKQENIFVECSGDKWIFKLADFGAAWPLNRANFPKLRISSRHSGPPEFSSLRKFKINLAKVDYFYLGNMLGDILLHEDGQDNSYYKTKLLSLAQFRDLLMKEQPSDRPADSKTLISLFNKKFCTKPSTSGFLKIGPQKYKT